MHKAKLKINPEKCLFGVTRGKVLGCLVSTKGIETSPDKIKAILQMQPPQTRKEVQKLAGRIAALNRFIGNWHREAYLSSVCYGASQKSSGARAAKSLRRSEVIPSAFAHVVKSRAGSTSHTICLYHTFCSE
jgi:hypothetical protein